MHIPVMQAGSASCRWWLAELRNDGMEGRGGLGHMDLVVIV